MVTEGGIAKWFSQNIISDLISIEDVCARDILEVEKQHTVQFMSRRKTIFDLEKTFENAFDKNQKLEAVFITENGKKDEGPLGIITSWDLVQITPSTLSLSSQT